MSNELVEKYRKKLNDVHLKGCENVLCGDVAYYTLWPKPPTKEPFIKIVWHLLRIFNMTFFSKYEFRINGNNPNVLCLFSSSYGERADLKRNFLKATNLIPERVDMLYSAKRSFLGFGFIKHLFKIISWNKQLKKLMPELSLRFLIIRAIYKAFIDYELFKEYEKKHNLTISKLVSNCDVHAVDSFFTQKFNAKNLLTVTFQHGAICSSYNKWALEGIKSKYFICHNQFTVDEAKMTSFNKMIIPAGVLSYIDCSESNPRSKLKIKNIGIFLDGEILRENNIKQILFITKYFKNTDYNLLFKFHPVSNIESYKDILPEKSEIYGKEISIVDFSKKIDLAIVCNSTVMIELLYDWIPVFNIHFDNQEADVFKNSKYFRFRNEEELTHILNRIGTESFIEELEQMRNYFCTDGDTKENYIKVFRQIGIINN